MTTLSASLLASLTVLTADITARANETLSSVFFTFQGRRYELTRFRAGRVEVYEESAEGIFMFLGYYDDLGNALPCLHGRAIAEGLQALEAVHNAHWATALPGADVWSQPRV